MTEPKDKKTKRNVIPPSLTRFSGGAKCPPQPKWERLSSRVICILGGNPSHWTLNGTNCYIVGTGTKRLLIDTGEGPIFQRKDPFLPNLEEVMREVGFNGIQAIIITHGHHDHYGGIDTILDRFGSDIPVFKKAGLPNGSLLWTRVQEKNLDHIFVKEGVIKFNPRESGPAPKLPDDIISKIKLDDKITHAELWRMIFFSHLTLSFSKKLGTTYKWIPLTDNLTITTEGATLRAIDTPGHCDDHFSFFLEEEQALFTGDSVLGHGTTFVHNMFQYMRSLHIMVDLQPKILYPAHGPMVHNGIEWLKGYIAHREKREELVWRILVMEEKAISTSEVARKIYTQTSKDAMKGAEENVGKILHKLALDGAVTAWKKRNGKLQKTKLLNDAKIRKDDVLWLAPGPRAKI